MEIGTAEYLHSMTSLSNREGHHIFYGRIFYILWPQPGERPPKLLDKLSAPLKEITKGPQNKPGDPGMHMCGDVGVFLLVDISQNINSYSLNAIS